MATALRLEEGFRPPTTAEELLTLPEGRHGEIVRGVYVEMTGTGTLHGVVALRIGRYVGAFVDEHALGVATGAETAFRLCRNPETTRCPDCAFIAAARLTGGLPRGVFEGAPDLAVEVLSPSNTSTEMQRKLAEYLRYGARQVWIADPDTHTVATHTAGALPRFLEAGDVLEGGDLLPGFSAPIAAFFAGLPTAQQGAEPPASEPPAQ